MDGIVLAPPISLISYNFSILWLSNSSASFIAIFNDLGFSSSGFSIGTVALMTLAVRGFCPGFGAFSVDTRYWFLLSFWAAGSSGGTVILTLSAVLWETQQKTVNNRSRNGAKLGLNRVFSKMFG